MIAFLYSVANEAVAEVCTPPQHPCAVLGAVPARKSIGVRRCGLMLKEAVKDSNTASKRNTTDTRKSCSRQTKRKQCTTNVNSPSPRCEPTSARKTVPIRLRAQHRRIELNCMGSIQRVQPYSRDIKEPAVTQGGINVAMGTEGLPMVAIQERGSN